MRAPKKPRSLSEQLAAVDKQSARFARSDGKARVAAQIVWSLSAGELGFRCLPKQAGGFEVQVRSQTDGWIHLADGVNAVDMLLRAATLLTVRRSIELHVSSLPR